MGWFSRIGVSFRKWLMVKSPTTWEIFLWPLLHRNLHILEPNMPIVCCNVIVLPITSNYRQNEKKSEKPIAHTYVSNNTKLKRKAKKL